jgi:hypothetical protein
VIDTDGAVSWTMETVTGAEVALLPFFAVATAVITQVSGAFEAVVNEYGDDVLSMRNPPFT